MMRSAALSDNEKQKVRQSWSKSHDAQQFDQMQNQLEAIVQRYTDKPHLFGGAAVEESKDKVTVSFTSDASEQKKLFIDDQIYVEQLLEGKEGVILEEDAENNSSSQNRNYFDRIASDGDRRSMPDGK